MLRKIIGLGILFLLISNTTQAKDDWQQLISELKQNTTAGELAVLVAVNLRINQLQWQSDQDNWQQSDYWATPRETLAAGKGDCEDLSIAKFSALLQLGINENKLRLSYVRFGADQQAHMVLIYQDGDTQLILDSLNNSIQTPNQRPELQQIYHFNRKTVWVANSSFSTKTLPSWENLLLRSRTQLASL